MTLEQSQLEHLEEILKEISQIVTLYFSPWGAAKIAQWEEYVGDGTFNAEAGLRAIESILNDSNKLA